ncbi:hypothetical protein Q9966_016634 [Columba livia]|nr:hypothetical protein Q9966_016634 [Columba livia]
MAAGGLEEPGAVRGGSAGGAGRMGRAAADLEEEEVEEFLAEVMDNEFDTAVEDGSLQQNPPVTPSIDQYEPVRP